MRGFFWLLFGALFVSQVGCSSDEDTKQIAQEDSEEQFFDEMPMAEADEEDTLTEEDEVREIPLGGGEIEFTQTFGKQKSKKLTKSKKPAEKKKQPKGTRICMPIKNFSTADFCSKNKKESGCSGFGFCRWGNATCKQTEKMCTGLPRTDCKNKKIDKKVANNMSLKWSNSFLGKGRICDWNSSECNDSNEHDICTSYFNGEAEKTKAACESLKTTKGEVLCVFTQSSCASQSNADEILEEICDKPSLEKCGKGKTKNLCQVGLSS